MDIGKKVTINDVASAAGVSKTTISRYINGQYSLMSTQTCERIKTVIDILNYHPSHIARSLKSKKYNMIGVVISDMESPFSIAVIIGIGNILQAHNYMPLFFNSNNSAKLENDALRTLVEKGVDGLIVQASSEKNNFLINIATQNMPIVLCDRYIKNYNFNIVSTKNEQIIFSAIEHIKAQGFTRPALFTQSWNNSTTRYFRKNFFVEAVNAIYGYNAEKDIYIIDNGNEPDSVLDQLKSFMVTVNAGEFPVIIGSNSFATVRAYHSIKRMGLSMPLDIGLCGPDDWDWDNGMNWPEILETNVTTMTIRSKSMGENCANLLLKCISDSSSEAQEILLSADLTIRDSTLLSKYL